MKIFISWSGPRGKALAEALRAWLARVFQGLDPWMSSVDIHAGKRWFTEVGSQLQSAHFGIICVTPESQSKPWLLFEAGAIGKSVDESWVVPFLLGVSENELTPGPLSQFQAKRATQRGTLELVQAINASMKGALTETILQETFTKWWGEFEEAIGRIEDMPREETGPPKRSESEMLEEILAATSAIARRVDEVGEGVSTVEKSVRAERLAPMWVNMPQRLRWNRMMEPAPAGGPEKSGTPDPEKPDDKAPDRSEGGE